MTSPPVGASGWPLGVRRPRTLWIPDYVSTAGVEAIELAAMAGLDADDWQQAIVMNMLGERADGRWAAFEVGLELARQNGKGGVYEIRELAGLFLLGERLLIHSAHEYKTAEQALDRMEALLEGCPDLSRRVRTVKRSHGQEGIYLKSGQALRYFTRTASGGRGFSCDFLGLDEAMKIKHSMHAAMFPTMAARPNAQILYAGSAVDQETMDDGIVFARLRERGIASEAEADPAEGDQRLMYVGYGAPFDNPSEVTAEDALDPENWAAANPALDIRITREYVAIEQRALSARGFAVERLGVGDWPSTDEEAVRIISAEAWAERRDARSTITGSMRFAFDVTPDRSMSSIGVGGLREDGGVHLEVIDRRPGTGWVAQRLADLTLEHETGAAICDGAGPAGSLIPDVEALNIEVHAVTAGEHAQACGMFVDGVAQQTLWHLGSPALASAIAGAGTRPLGDSWAWSRKSSDVDISPLVACTLAGWGVKTMPSTEPWVVMM